MAVYGDLYFLMNALCDLIVLSLCAAVLHLPVKKRRLFLSSSIGGAFAFLTLFLPRTAAVLLSFPAGFLMIFAAFSFESLRAFLLRTLIFYLSCFLLSGGVQLLASLLEKALPPVLSALLLLFLLALFSFFALLFFEILKKKAAVTTASLSFTYDEKNYLCTALVDSGNLLEEGEPPLPVIIVFSSLFDTPPPSEHIITAQTIAGNISLSLLDAKKILINDLAASAHIALCPDLSTTSAYQALLPASLCHQSTVRKKGSFCFHFSKD